jgi:hypothetical protein
VQLAKSHMDNTQYHKDEHGGVQIVNVLYLFEYLPSRMLLENVQ